MEIVNLAALQKQPDALFSNGVPSELPRWSAVKDRHEHFRARVDSMTFAGMTAEELHIYFMRHGVDATQSWNRQQSLFGRLLNRFTVPQPGYAKINGRVLRQFYDVMEVEAGEAFTASAELYLRADIAAEIAILVQSKGADL